MADVVAEVDLLVQDGSLALAQTAMPGGAADKEKKELRLSGDVNDRFLDGPACRRIAIVDFDPATGLPSPPPATFTPFKSNPRSGTYVADGDETSAATIAINAFGTVFQTVRMFEGPDALGRQVEWAFGSEQLLVVPRAGEWANAFYERATRSLQFFSFAGESGARVHTALSRDIVAHECGHALLDAVAPSLYDSSTPQSVAIHEAVADLVAVIMALDSRRLREAVLARSDNSLAGTERVHRDRRGVRHGSAGRGRRGPARAAGAGERRDARDPLGARPHVLSTLLSAIFYDTLSVIFATGSRTSSGPTRRCRRGAGGGRQQGARHRPDHLPPAPAPRDRLPAPGRAQLRGRRPGDPGGRPGRPSGRDASEGCSSSENFAAQFVERLVVADRGSSTARQPQELAVPADQVARLHASDWAAYEYVTRAPRDARASRTACRSPCCPGSTARR